MMHYNTGDVVLLKFPYSDTTNIKKRPALVILDTEDEDIIVVRITTQVYDTKYDIKINEWEKAGLLAPSVIRLHKIATINKDLVERRLGSLVHIDLDNVRIVFNNILVL